MTFTGSLGPSFPLSSCSRRTQVLVLIRNTNICKQNCGSEPEVSHRLGSKAGLTDAAAAAGATHPVPAAASVPAAAGLAAGVGGALSGDRWTVGPLTALEVTAALEEPQGNNHKLC